MLEEEVIAISPASTACAFALVALVQLIFHRTASVYDTRMQLQLLVACLILLVLLPRPTTAWTTGEACCGSDVARFLCVGVRILQS